MGQLPWALPQSDIFCLLCLHPKGKGLFATRNIHKGETIFMEKPVVSSQFLWNAWYNYKGEDAPGLEPPQDHLLSGVMHPGKEAGTQI